MTFFQYLGPSIAQRILTTAVALLLGLGSALAADDRLPTVDEAAAELVTLTQKLTPFTFRYDAANKEMIYREMIESGDKATNNRAGELRVRVDRLDPKRITYLPGVGMKMVVQGRPIAGGMSFFCLPDQRCVRRGYPDPQTGRLDAEPSAEAHYTLDIAEGGILNDLRRFAGLVQILAGHDPD
jgi:hypothetical protein